jgi:hypothetical protein
MSGAKRVKRRMVLQDFMCFFLSPASHGLKDKAGKLIGNGDILCSLKVLPQASWNIGDVEIGIVSGEDVHYFTTFGGEGYSKLSEAVCKMPRGLYWRDLARE